MLAGQRVEVETPHPRAATKGLAERLDGRVLESIEAIGKNVLLHFEGGLVLRSHLRMTGRWRVERRGASRSGRPWLVLRGDEHEAVLWNGPVLELARDARRSRSSVRTSSRAAGLRRDARAAAREQQTRAVGDAVLDQRLVAGIGNMWKAEALWQRAVSPWRALADVSDEELRAALAAAAPPDARPARRRPAAAPRLPPGRPRLPALRRADPLVSAGRGRPDGLLVPGLPKRRAAPRARSGSDALSASPRHAAPLLSRRVRVLPTQARISRSPSRSTGRTAARRSTNTARSCAASSRRTPTGCSSATTCAKRVDDLRREPRPRSSRARTRATRPTRLARSFAACSCRSLVRTAEGCGGFDWDDSAFDRAYAELEDSLFARDMRTARSRRSSASPAARRSSSATASACVRRDRRARRDVAGSAGCCRGTSAASPTACACSSSSARSPGREAPDAPGELADAVTALRLATAGAGRRRAGALRAARLAPVRVRPVLQIAATRRPASRRGSTRSARRSRRSCGRCSRSPTRTQSSATRSTAGSSRSSRTIRSAASSCATRSTPRSATAKERGRRACAPRRSLGETAQERAQLVDARREPTTDLVRRLLVAMLLHGNRRALLRELDATLLGSRTRCTAARKLTHLQR